MQSTGQSRGGSKSPDRGKDHHAEVNPEALDGKLRIVKALICRAKQVDKLPGDAQWDSDAGYAVPECLQGDRFLETIMGTTGCGIRWCAANI